MRLKSDAAHRARDSQLRQIAGRPLQRPNDRAPHEYFSDRRDLDGFTVTAKRLLNEGCHLGTVFRDDGQRFRWKPRLLQRIKSFFGPSYVLEHTYGKPSGLDVDHGGVMYHGRFQGTCLGAACTPALSSSTQHWSFGFDLRHHHHRRRSLRILARLPAGTTRGARRRRRWLTPT